MKTLLLTIASVIAINTLNAQQTNIAFLNSDEIDTHLLSEHKYVRESNSGDSKTISGTLESNFVKEIESEAFLYNIKNNNVYDNSEEATYRVIFKRKHGEIIAIYNNSGDILSKKGVFKNIRLPIDLRIKVSKTYPGWSFKSNTYYTHYIRNQELQEAYKIKITKKNRSKVLKIAY